MKNRSSYSTVRPTGRITFWQHILPLCFAQLLLTLAVVGPASAQVEPPDRKYLFREDKVKKEVRRQKKQNLKARKKASQQQRISAGQLPFDIEATTLDYDSTGNIIHAAGNVIITYSTLVAEAMRGKVDIAKNEAELVGDVRLSDVGSNLTADSAYLNLKDGSGRLDQVDIYFEEGDYRLTSERAERGAGEEYSLYNTDLTTCDCPEQGSCPPWSLTAKEAHITREGYGRAWHTTFNVLDVPVFYFPYLIFPAKNERQSGFLAASVGSGRQSGFDLALPFFWAIDRSTDATITGIYQSSSRVGVDTEVRKIFSYNHRHESGYLYFDESLRDGDLQGTRVDELDDKTFDENRFGGYIDHAWRGKVGPARLQVLIDGNYVSDDLFLREYERSKIAEYNTRFVTSRAVVRAPLGDSYSFDLSSEYNQAMVEDPNFRTLDADDIVLQRLPQADIYGISTLRPFGENPFGLKLVFSSNLSAVQFARREGYDGLRTEMLERVRLPFYYKNYFDGSLEGSLRGTLYNLDNTDVLQNDTGPSSDEEAEDGLPPNVEEAETEVIEDDMFGETFEGLEKSSNRLVPGLTSRVGTVLEKVIPLEEGNPLRSIAELGRLGRRESLQRVKHTIEPGLKHQFVPDIDQSENPQFDSSDRLAERNVMTYSLTQRLYGRYEPRNEYLYGIEEATPQLEDLGSLRTEGVVDEAGAFGYEAPAGAGGYIPVRRGSLVELANLKLAQSFDFVEQREDRDPSRDPLSDLAAEANLYPNEYVRLRARTDFNVEDQDFDSYSIAAQLTDKRGDSIRTGLRFVTDAVRQLETGLEFRISQNVKLGYYSRFDDLAGEFIEQKAGLRFWSSCNCWVFDIDVADRSNPDETRLSFTVNLIGLGEVGNTFFTSPGEERN